MNADGSDRRTLTPSGTGLPKVIYGSPVFPPDGRHLAFVAGDGCADIWVANPTAVGPDRSPCGVTAAQTLPGWRRCVRGYGLGRRLSP
jgi:hypothetical protein